MIFFSRGSHGRGNRGRGNWNRGPRRPILSIHFDVDSQELGQLFQDGIFIGLEKEWSNLGLKGLPSKPHRFLVSLCPLMSHCNLKFPKTTDGKRLSTQQSPNIVVGPICPYLLPSLLTIFPTLRCNHSLVVVTF